MTKTKTRGDGDRRDQMGAVEQPDIELVAYVRPGDFPHQFDVEAFLGREALVDRDQQRGRVGERDEPDAQARIAHRSSSAAVITDCATSAIFLFSFIAVLRSSA